MKLLIIILFLCFCFCIALSYNEDEEPRRSQFPHGFLFGASTSSYQIEGAIYEDGRGPNNWDSFTHIPGKIANGYNADVAADHYHRWEDDVELLHSLGVNAYRFSLSWSRILPRGRFGGINYNGINFYNKLIDNLLLKGITPFVTLSHDDVPLELEDRYKSWLSPLIQEDFLIFAELCFKSFGDRVKYWVTINEPVLFTKWAYVLGTYPPGRCSAPFGNCSSGNSLKEPLIVIHNMILSHTKATEAYRKYYKPKQGGHIGIVVDCTMFEPYRDNDIGRDASNRAFAFDAAWVLDPLIHGNYPPEMHQCLGEDLPVFSADESNKMKDSLDFIGINHYGSLYAKDCIHSVCDPKDNHPISGYVHLTGERDGDLIGEKTAMPDFYVVPNGMERIIGHMKTRYGNKPMFVTENGEYDEVKPDEKLGYPENGLSSEGKLLHDNKRVEYHKSYLASLARAIEGGADVKGYFIWSFIDNFEWTAGYSLRFGLHYVDFETLERKPKLSAKWYRDFLGNGTGYQENIAHNDY